MRPIISAARALPGRKHSLNLRNEVTVQSQKAVSAYFTTKQILPSGFAEQCSRLTGHNSSHRNNEIKRTNFMRNSILPWQLHEGFSRSPSYMDPADVCGWYPSQNKTLVYRRASVGAHWHSHRSTFVLVQSRDMDVIHGVQRIYLLDLSMSPCLRLSAGLGQGDPCLWTISPASQNQNPS